MEDGWGLRWWWKNFMYLRIYIRSWLFLLLYCIWLNVSWFQSGYDCWNISETATFPFWNPQLPTLNSTLPTNNPHHLGLVALSGELANILKLITLGIIGRKMNVFLWGWFGGLQTGIKECGGYRRRKREWGLFERVCSGAWVLESWGNGERGWEVDG